MNASFVHQAIRKRQNISGMNNSCRVLVQVLQFVETQKCQNTFPIINSDSFSDLIRKKKKSFGCSGCILLARDCYVFETHPVLLCESNQGWTNHTFISLHLRQMQVCPTSHSPRSPNLKILKAHPSEQEDLNSRQRV